MKIFKIIFGGKDKLCGILSKNIFVSALKNNLQQYELIIFWLKCNSVSYWTLGGVWVFFFVLKNIFYILYPCFQTIVLYTCLSYFIVSSNSRRTMSKSLLGFSSSGRVLRFCIFNKLAGEANVAGLWITHWIAKICIICLLWFFKCTMQLKHL